MLQNILEVWYWIIMLALMAGLPIYFAVDYARELWKHLKQQLDDDRPTVFAERITEPYSKRMVRIHWLTLALLVITWYLGDALVGERNERNATLAGYLVHAVLGSAVLVVTIKRMIYRSLDRMPQPVSNALVGMLAKGVHNLLYILLILLPSTGFMALLTSGVGAALVTINARLLPAEYSGVGLISIVSHDYLMTALMVVALIHILGVLWHQFIRKDGLIKRMSLRGKKGARLKLFW